MNANIPRKPIDQIRDLLKKASAAEARLQRIEAEIMGLKVALCVQVCRTPDEVQTYLNRLSDWTAQAVARKAAGPEAESELLRSLLATIDLEKPDA